MQTSENKLFVVWQDNQTRLRHIIGELSKNEIYEFHYFEDNVKGLKDTGFVNLTAFPDLAKNYTSDGLFPAFSTRLPDRRRTDIGNILCKYGLSRYDEFELLKKSGGRLPTDSLEFVEPINLSYDFIRREFYIAGVRYYYNKSQDLFLSLKPQMILSYKMEPDNKWDSTAVQILSQGNVIGYIPSFFSKPVTEAIHVGRNVRVSILEIKPYLDNLGECIKAELIIE